VYRLDEGHLVLVGNQQHRVLQFFLQKQYLDGRTDLTSEQKASFDSDMEQYLFLLHTERLITTVRMTTEEYRDYSYGRERINLSAVLKSLKRGPLGPAIDLPGHERKGRGYVVRIMGFPELWF
jgi:hypothetical protein